MAAGSENDLPAEGEDTSEEDVLLTFHYIKSNQFRVIHVDGMVGGVSPAGDAIEMALFSERVPIPVKTVHKVGPEGSQEQVDWDGRDGITREVDVNAIMSIETAEIVGAWLLDQVKIARQNSDDEGEQ